jgi:hypothetical protein
MDAISGNALLEARLAALVRDDERIRVLREALPMVARTLYDELMRRGWGDIEALATVMSVLAQAHNELAEQTFPD